MSSLVDYQLSSIITTYYRYHLSIDNVLLLLVLSLPIIITMTIVTITVTITITITITSIISISNLALRPERQAGLEAVPPAPPVKWIIYEC